MAKAWVWVSVGIVFLLVILWAGRYSYTYAGVCRDDYGRSYACQKTNYNSDLNENAVRYSYSDPWGNKVTIKRYGHDFDDYYDCYHAKNLNDRYGRYLRENYGLVCRNYEAMNEYNVIETTKEVTNKPPIVYVK